VTDLRGRVAYGLRGSEPPFWSMSEAAALRAVAARGAVAPARARRGAPSIVRVLGRQFASPITLILIVAALIASSTGDLVDGSIILAIVLASAVLGAWQEGRAGKAVAALLAQVQVTVAVLRGGETLHVATGEVLPGDRLVLAAGDIVPGDCLLTASHVLMVDESALTGESFPTEKAAGAPVPAGAPLSARTNAVFAGTSVVSGTGSALVVLTGAATSLGHISSSLARRSGATSFELGVRRFGLLLLRVMLALVGAILVIDLLLHRPLIDSLLFALALAVGITPQMLPVVVTVSLAAGARRMARNQVVVKRLDVIEDLGAMTVLCTDKTGTVTAGVVGVDGALDADGADSPAVLDLAVLNAGLQTGYPNPLDLAILAEHRPPVDAVRLDELPYDFQRKRLSVVTEVAGARTLITKGALDSVLACCSSASGLPLTADGRRAIQERTTELGSRGYRVVGVATRVLGDAERDIEVAAERDLEFVGMLTFHDPIKPTAAASIADLESLGVQVKVISGDNRAVTGALAGQLSLAGRIVLGAEVEHADEEELRRLVTENALFAEVEPAHKRAIVEALRATGETVGFLGDGINDAEALHRADVGLSVQTAVDVAKEAAGIVLLTRDLGVVATGVRLGRRTFANTLKYVRVAASSNFGNILSMVVAAAVLPFLPMLPAQILLLNFLADIPNTLVSRDRVDPERLTASGAWDMRAITRFMVVFGAVSTVFDLMTFGVLEWGFHAGATTFHTAWFVESALTQFIAMMTLRTGRPAWRSRPDGIFLAVSAGVAVLTAVLPFTVLAPVLGFTALPASLLVAIAVIAVLYGSAIEGMKRLVSY
jgi:Mg2+-importing ATPase